MKKGTIIAIALAAVLAAGGYYYASPYLALRALHQAAKDNNIEGINDHVDFPAVRENLKNSFNAQMTKEMGKKKGGGWEQMGTALAMAFAGPLIEAFVTPQNLAAVIRGEDIGTPGNEKKTPKPPADPPDLKPHYETKDRFVVEMVEKGKDEKAPKTGLVFRREGLFGWKLYSLRLPEE